MAHATHHDDHHPMVPEPVFREASTFARALAPVVALAILAFLSYLFSQNPMTNNLSMLDHMAGEPTALNEMASEQPAEPLVMQDVGGQAVEIPLPPATPAATLAEVDALNAPAEPAPAAPATVAPAQ